MFTDGDGLPIHPHSISQTFERIARRADVRIIRLHDYADLRVMPTSLRGPVRRMVIGPVMSA